MQGLVAIVIIALLTSPTAAMPRGASEEIASRVQQEDHKLQHPFNKKHRTLTIHWHPNFFMKGPVTVDLHLGSSISIFCYEDFPAKIVMVPAPCFRDCTLKSCEGMHKILATCNKPYAHTKTIRGASTSKHDVAFGDNRFYYFTSFSNSTNEGYNNTEKGQCAEYDMKFEMIIRSSLSTAPEGVFYTRFYNPPPMPTSQLTPTSSIMANGYNPHIFLNPTPTILLGSVTRGQGIVSMRSNERKEVQGRRAEIVKKEILGVEKQNEDEVEFSHSLFALPPYSLVMKRPLHPRSLSDKMPPALAQYADESGNEYGVMSMELYVDSSVAFRWMPPILLLLLLLITVF